MNARELRKAIQKIPDDYPVLTETLDGLQEITGHVVIKGASREEATFLLLVANN